MDRRRIWSSMLVIRESDFNARNPSRVRARPGPTAASTTCIDAQVLAFGLIPKTGIQKNQTEFVHKTARVHVGLRGIRECSHNARNPRKPNASMTCAEK
jgi:hypothetical protein